MNNIETHLPMDDPDTEFTSCKKDILRAINKCNQFLNSLTSFLDVILIPSLSDFSDSFYPVQPFKPFSLGIGSTRDKHLKIASNPCLIQVDPRNDKSDEQTSKFEKVEL